MKSTARVVKVETPAGGHRLGRSGERPWSSWFWCLHPSHLKDTESWRAVGAPTRASASVGESERVG